MRLTVVRYRADGWGTGGLWLAGGRLVAHELPGGDARARSDHDQHPLADRFAAYFAGARDDFADVELDLDWCTPFQRDVADALRRVSRGEVVSYGELAALAGHPGAQRAAGTFCAANRYPLALPCHRVVSAGGLGGYGSLGPAYKSRLLALEGVDVDAL